MFLSIMCLKILKINFNLLVSLVWIDPRSSNCCCCCSDCYHSSLMLTRWFWLRPSREVAWGRRRRENHFEPLIWFFVHDLMMWLDLSPETRTRGEMEMKWIVPLIFRGVLAVAVQRCRAPRGVAIRRGISVAESAESPHNVCRRPPNVVLNLTKYRRMREKTFLCARFYCFMITTTTEGKILYDTTNMPCNSFVSNHFAAMLLSKT